MIVIPEPLVLDNNTFKLGLGKHKSKVKLEESDKGQTSNALYDLMLKFLMNPLTTGSHKDIEKNLRRYLNLDFMEEASEQTSEMKFDREEYQEHIKTSWELLISQDMLDFLDELRHFFRGSSVKLDEDDFKHLKRNLKGQNLKVERYLDNHGFKLILGKTRRSKEANKLRDVADTKSIYEEALDKLQDYITVNITKKETVNAKAPKYVVEGAPAIVEGEKITYEFKINTEEMFKDIFNELNLNPKNMKKADNITIEEIARDYKINIVDPQALDPPEPKGTLEVNPVSIDIDDIRALEDKTDTKYIFWLPDNIEEKLNTNKQLENKIISMNLKLAWNEYRHDYADNYELLDDDDKELLLLLYNAKGQDDKPIMKAKSIYSYIYRGIVPSQRNWTSDEKAFFEKEVSPRAGESAKIESGEKGDYRTSSEKEPTFINEMEEKLWLKHNKTVSVSGRNMPLFIVHAPDSSKHNEKELFETPIDYKEPKITVRGLKNAAKYDKTGELSKLLKQMLSVESIGLHTLEISVLIVEKEHILVAQQHIKGPTTEKGPYTAKNKEIWQERLDDSWNVFQLLDFRYTHKASPYFGDGMEVTPQQPRNPKDKMVYIDWEREPKPRTNVPMGLSREESSGSIGIINPKNRLFHTYIRKGLRKLKRYIDG